MFCLPCEAKPLVCSYEPLETLHSMLSRLIRQMHSSLCFKQAFQAFSDRQDAVVAMQQFWDAQYYSICSKIPE